MSKWDESIYTHGDVKSALKLQELVKETISDIDKVGKLCNCNQPHSAKPLLQSLVEESEK